MRFEVFNRSPVFRFPVFHKEPFLKFFLSLGSKERGFQASHAVTGNVVVVVVEFPPPRRRRARSGVSLRCFPHRRREAASDGGSSHFLEQCHHPDVPVVVG